MIPEQTARRAIELAGQGWNVSQIARHLEHERKTIRVYLNGLRAPGQPRPHAGYFPPFAGYIRQRAGDDAHLRGTGLHREITALGYAGSYPAFTRELRGHSITACHVCSPRQASMPRPQRRPAPLPVRVAPRSPGRRSAPTCPVWPPPATCRRAPSLMSSRNGSPAGPLPATTWPPQAGCSPATPGAWPR